MPAPYCDKCPHGNPQCDIVHGSVLTGVEIKQLGLVRLEDDSEPEGNLYKPASFDMLLHREYVVVSDGDDGRIRERLRYPSITVPKFGAVIIASREIVQLPYNVVGRFNIRYKLALKGLFVQMGTQVEPGYHGRLFAMLQNISNQPIHLTANHYDTRIFTIEFSYTSRCTGPEAKPAPPLLTLEQALSSGTAKETIGELISRLEKATSEGRHRNEIFRAIMFSVVALIATLIASAIPSYLVPYVTSEFIGIYAMDAVESMPPPAWATDHEGAQQTRLQLEELGSELDSMKLELQRITDKLEQYPARGSGVLPLAPAIEPDTPSQE